MSDVTGRVARDRTPMVVTRRVTQAELADQRAKGWPDFHPEDYCHRCGGPNLSWWVDSDIWNAVMGADEWRWQGIVCPSCFAALAGDATFELRPDPATRSGRDLLQRAARP